MPNNYNTRLKPFARTLRNSGTKAEACLWKYALRAGQMKGYNFRRQRPVMDFIADFMCIELKLIIEVDGITHDEPEVVIRDIKKEHTLRASGYTVLRFSDTQVLDDISNVRVAIETWIEDHEKMRW